METLFDEREADKELIGSLINTNRILWRELERARDMLKLHQQHKQGTVMQKKILQDLNGALYIAKEFEEITVEEAQKLYDHFKDNIALLEKVLFKDNAPADQPANGGDNGQPDQGAATNGSQPSQDGQPAAGGDNGTANPPATDPNAPAQGTDAAPTDQPASDQNQVSDPNANPVQTAPASDPNQAQPAPEQPVMPPLQ